MVTNDEIMAKLDDILAAVLDVPAASRRYGLEKPSPFSMGSSEPVNTPAIPNGPDEPPHVWEAGIVQVLALFDIPGLGQRWYAELSSGAYVAEIRPFSEAQKTRFTGCGDPVPDAYSYGTPRKPSPNWTLVKRVRNPEAQVPSGCRLAADGVSLEADV